MAWHDGLGGIGAALVVAAYLLLQLERMASDGVVYLLMNAVGAGLILLSLLFAFNLSAFLIEAFWLAISLFGLYRRGRRPAF